MMLSATLLKVVKMSFLRTLTYLVGGGLIPTNTRCFQGLQRMFQRFQCQMLHQNLLSLQVGAFFFYPFSSLLIAKTVEVPICTKSWLGFKNGTVLRRQFMDKIETFTDSVTVETCTNSKQNVFDFSNLCVVVLKSNIW